MKRIRKNRLLLVRDKGEEDELNKEYKQNRISTIDPRKKILQPIIIVSSFAILVVAAVLILTKYYYKEPQVIEPSQQDTLFSGSEKREIPETETKNIHLEKGKESYYRGDYNNAKARFLEVVESDANDEEKAIALTYIGIIYDDREDFNKAIEYYLRALKYDDRNTTIYRNLSLAYKHKGDLKDAAKIIKKGLNIDPKNINNQILFGNILYEQGNYSEAVTQYGKALEQDPQNPTALYNLAITLLKTGDELSGIEYLKKAGAADRIGKIAHYAYSKLGIIFSERKDYDFAKKYLTLAISINPKDPIDRYNLGIVYLKQNKVDRALEELLKAEELGKHDVELLENLGDAYYSLREYDKSIKTYKRLLDVDRRNIKILSRVAEIFYEKGELDKAYDYYMKITTLEPVSENARIAFLNMGNILDDTKRFDEAIQTYMKALDIDPKDDSTLYNLGIAYKHAGKPELAIRSWRKASELNPDKPKHMMAIADYYYENNIFDAAMDEYKAILRRWPDIQDTHFNLASIYYKMDLLDYSRKEFMRVIELNGNNELAQKAYINLGIIISKKEENDAEAIEDARSYIQKALLLKPGDPQALIPLGHIYVKSGMVDKAIDTFYQAISATRDTRLIAECYNDIGKCYYKLGRYKKALQAFTRGIEEEPTLEEIRINRKVAMQAYEKELER